VMTSPDKKIEEAAAVAKEAQVAIVVIGELERMSGEAASRTSIGLPGGQLKLAQAVIDTGTPTVVVVMTGRPLALNRLTNRCDALVLAWQLGSEHGNALADLLIGDAAPSGRLPVTMPRTLGQVPIAYDARNTGRPKTDHKYTTKYIDAPNSPLFPFGYGLTYTSFKYSEPSVSPDSAGPNGKVAVKLTLTNTGNRAGAEVVQVYAHDVLASVTLPLRKLVGFKRVELDAGESREISIEIPLRRMWYTGIDMLPTLEPGQVDLYVGPNSMRGQKVSFTVTD
jgi:beta-glucosidase